MASLNRTAAKPVSPGTSPTISAIRKWKAAFSEIAKNRLPVYTNWEGKKAVKNLDLAELLDVAALRRVNNAYWEERGRKDIIIQLSRLVQQYLEFHGRIKQKNQESRDKTEHLEAIYRCSWYDKAREPLKARAALYLRVSSNGQDTGAQETALREYVSRRNWTVHGVYKDLAVSGAQSSRPALDKLLLDCRRRKFDVLLVWKFDRFARSLKTLISGLEVCRAFGIDFVSVTEAVDTSLPAGELLFHLISAVSQFERSLIIERVKAGLEHARKTGRVLGRPPIRKLTKKEIAQLRADRAQSKLPFRKLAEKFGISVWTAHQLCSRRTRTQ